MRRGSNNASVACKLSAVNCVEDSVYIFLWIRLIAERLEKIKVLLKATEINKDLGSYLTITL